MRSPRRFYARITKGEDVPTPVKGGVKLLSHWLFQGVFRMDVFGRSLKLASTLLGATAVYSLGVGVLTSLVVGHTINFLVNSHVVAAVQTLGVSVYDDRGRFAAVASSLLDGLSRRTWVKDAYVTGSVNRGEWHPGSDLDVIVVRKAGLSHGVRGAVGALRARFVATVKLFPLDVYVFDERTLRDREVREELVPYVPTDGEDSAA